MPTDLVHEVKNSNEYYFIRSLKRTFDRTQVRNVRYKHVFGKVFDLLNV